MENIIRHANGQRSSRFDALLSSWAGRDVLADIEEELNFAGDELQRMEDEGGIPLSKEETRKIDKYFKTSQRIKAVMQAKHNMLPKQALSPLFQID